MEPVRATSRGRPVMFSCQPQPCMKKLTHYKNFGELKAEVQPIKADTAGIKERHAKFETSLAELRLLYLKSKSSSKKE